MMIDRNEMFVGSRQLQYICVCVCAFESTALYVGWSLVDTRRTSTESIRLLNFTLSMLYFSLRFVVCCVYLSSIYRMEIQLLHAGCHRKEIVYANDVKW